MPTIDLTDAERAALVALIRRAIEEDRFPPRGPRLDPLRSPLAKLDAAVAALKRPPAGKSPLLRALSGRLHGPSATATWSFGSRGAEDAPEWNEFRAAGDKGLSARADKPRRMRASSDLTP
jgi:hypothetical protein